MTPDPTNMDDPDAPCSCSEAQAQETHELVAALAEAGGIDVCGPDAHGIHGDDDLGNDLQMIHDLSIAQGAHCDPSMGDDEPDDDDPSGEHPAADPFAEFLVARLPA